jgi:hypothetical protein
MAAGYPYQHGAPGVFACEALAITPLVSGYRGPGGYLSFTPTLGVGTSDDWTVENQDFVGGRGGRLRASRHIQIELEAGHCPWRTVQAELGSPCPQTWGVETP